MQDLIQFQGRDRWYEAKFCADDAPDWNPAVFLRKEETTPGLQTVVLEIEISRDRVPIRNAYKHVGQLAAVRVNGGVDRSLKGVTSDFAMLCSMPSKIDITSSAVTSLAQSTLLTSYLSRIVALDYALDSAVLLNIATTL